MRISDWSSDVCSSDLFQLSCRQATIRKRRRAATMAEVTIKGRDGSFKAYLALPRTTPAAGVVVAQEIFGVRSEEHTSELQSLMRISYAVFCLKKKKNRQLGNIRH